MVPLVAWIFIILSSRWDYGAMGIHFTQYGRVRGGDTYPEKTRPAGVIAEGGNTGTENV